MKHYIGDIEKRTHMKERIKFNTNTDKYIKHINKHKKVCLYCDGENKNDYALIVRLGRQR